MTISDACDRIIKHADVAELADALDSGSSRGNSVQVQFLSGAPNSTNPNPRPIGEGFVFVVYFDYPNLNLKKNKPNGKTEVKKNESKHFYFIIVNYVSNKTDYSHICLPAIHLFV